jgi:hypothetical protein
MLVFLCGCVILSFPFAWVNFSSNGSFSRVAYRQSGKGEGPYPVGGVGYPRLARLRLLAARVLREFARSPGQDVLSVFSVKLFAKNGTIFLGGGGIPPAVAPEGDLVYGEKAESPLTLFKREFTYVQPTRAADMCKKLGNPF